MFVRHYEDAAQTIRAVDKLPDMDRTPIAFAEDVLVQRDIAALPTSDEPALRLIDAD